MRLTASSHGDDSDLSISLLATDTPSLPTLPAGHHFLSIYEMTGGDTLSGDINVIARYDDARLTWQHLDETQVKLWYFTDGDWTRVYDGFYRDLENNWVSGNIPADAHYFAVSTPEPASAMALLGTGALLLLRRNRKPR